MGRNYNKKMNDFQKITTFFPLCGKNFHLFLKIILTVVVICFTIYFDGQIILQAAILRQERKRMMEAKISSDLLRGHTDTIVLGCLQTQDRYGFEIYNRILQRTGEQIEWKQTTLYSSYTRLEKDGCIVSYWGDETQGARRKYYHITEKGRRVYRQNKLDFEFTQKIIRDLLTEEDA
jgi:DNA-binding PadR family transcriptional regulator